VADRRVKLVYGCTEAVWAQRAPSWIEHAGEAAGGSLLCASCRCVEEDLFMRGECRDDGVEALCNVTGSIRPGFLEACFLPLESASFVAVEPCGSAGK
jgi:hypothetical protein